MKLTFRIFRPLRGFFFPLVLLLVAGCNQTVPSDQDLLVKTKSIVQGIDDYKTAHSSLPKSLSEITVPSIPAAELSNDSTYVYTRSPSDSSKWQLEAVSTRIPTRSVILFRSNKNYDDCKPGGSLHASYKIVEAVPLDGLMLLREQTD